jgi:hypothetical protein
MFRRRKNVEQLYVVLITIHTEGDAFGRIGESQCVIGPMTADAAVEFTDLAEGMVSADWGESLNAVRAAVTFTPLLVDSPASAGDWTRHRIELAVAMGEMTSLMRRGAGKDWDGLIKDGTGWDRPERNHPSAWGHMPPKTEDDDE